MKKQLFFICESAAKDMLSCHVDGVFTSMVRNEDQDAFMSTLSPAVG